MAIEFSHKLTRDGQEVEVTVYADHFVSDHSVGIGLYPEELRAADAFGIDVPLTDEEAEELSDKAVEAYQSIDDAADAADLRDIADGEE